MINSVWSRQPVNGNACYFKLKHKRFLSLTGFTLLEVLLATVIISVGVTALVWAFSSGLFATTDIENLNLATNIAQANMEMVKSKNFADINTTAKISNLVSNLGFSNFNVSAAVGEGQNPLPVNVTVCWNVKGGQANTTLTTLVTDY